MPDTYFDQNTPTPENGSPSQSEKPSKKRKLSKKALILGGGLLALLLVGGVTAGVVLLSNDKNNPASSSQQKEVVSISITADGFVPANVQVKPNTLVVWTNKDTVSHAVTVTDKNAVSLGMSEQLAPGESYSVILDEEKDYYVQSPVNGAQRYQGVIKVSNKVNGNE